MGYLRDSGLPDMEKHKVKKDILEKNVGKMENRCEEDGSKTSHFMASKLSSRRDHRSRLSFRAEICILRRVEVCDG